MYDTFVTIIQLINLLALTAVFLEIYCNSKTPNSINHFRDKSSVRLHLKSIEYHYRSKRGS